MSLCEWHGPCHVDLLSHGRIEFDSHINLVVNPDKNYCTGLRSASSSNYAPQLTLTPSTPNVTVRVELTNGAGNCNNGPSIIPSP